MLYYAFIAKAPGGEWRARFVDFPEWQVSAPAVQSLAGAAGRAVRERSSGGQVFFPKPKAFSDLPRVEREGGYWMGFDLRDPIREVGGTVNW